MKNYFLAWLLVSFGFLGLTPIYAESSSLATPPGEEKKYTVSGYVKDATSGEELIGVSIFLQNAQVGTVTNVYGFYSLSLQPGTYSFQFSYVGYEPIIRKVNLEQDTQLNIELIPEEINLQEVVVSATKPNEQVEMVQMSTVKMEIAEVKKMPQLLGEVDLIRSIQLLPGVTTVGEGATGFNVRGGNIDENLILLDEAPVYNASHVLGFFSVFNADAIKDVQLYRGGIPSVYGGRLSSVLDIRQKEGNMKQFSGAGGIGMISSRLMLEGPIAKEKSSFMLAGRRSYADVFTALSSDENVKDSKAYFYDLNAKVNYILNDHNRLFLSGYFGRDVLGVGEEAGFDWGNKTATLRWNHLFSPKVFSNLTLVASDYDYALEAGESTNFFSWKSSILNYNAKADFSWFASPQHTIDAGISGMYYQFQPGKTDAYDIQTVKLNYSSPYFKNETTPPTTGAEVVVLDDLGQEFVFQEGIGDSAGIYTKEFQPEVGRSYSLYIKTAKGEEYQTSPQEMEAVGQIDTIYYEFVKKDLFNEEEGYVTILEAKDIEGVTNFFRWRYFVNGEFQNKPDHLVFAKDQLVDGSSGLIVLFYQNKLKEGDLARVEQMSISKEAYAFLNLLNQQTSNAGSQFSTPPAPIRGNIHNLQESRDYALGFFMVSSASVREIEIKPIKQKQ